MSYLAHGSQFLECWSQTARNLIVWNVQKNKYRYFFCLGVTGQVDRPTTSSVLWVHSGCDCHSSEIDFVAHPGWMSDAACARQGAVQRILYDPLCDKITAVKEWLSSCLVERIVRVFYAGLQFLVISALNPVIFTSLSKCLFLKSANSRNKLVYKTERLALLWKPLIWFIFKDPKYRKMSHIPKALFTAQKSSVQGESVSLWCNYWKRWPWLIAGPLCWAQQACSYAWVQVHGQVCCRLRSHGLAGQSHQEGYRRVNCLRNFSGVCIINANEGGKRALSDSASLQVLSALQTEVMEYDQPLDKLVVLRRLSLADRVQKVSSWYSWLACCCSLNQAD